MKKIKTTFFNHRTEKIERSFDPGTFSDSDIHVEDARVAKLLLVLSELDESFGGVEGIEPSQLRDLIYNALPACGFTNSRDACYAIATVLRIIEGGEQQHERDRLPEGTSFPSDLQNVRWFSPC